MLESVACQAFFCARVLRERVVYARALREPLAGLRMRSARGRAAGLRHVKERGVPNVRFAFCVRANARALRERVVRLCMGSSAR
eukprot:8957396-Lingulodinium_polyedra.AAC.1